MFQRILVPLDGSQCGEQAIPVAAHIARASGSSLILVRVVDITANVSWQAPDTPVDITDLIEAEQEGASLYLTNVANVPELAHVDVLKEVITGMPGDALLSVAQEKRADLIVMSSHGYTGLKKWVLGSVAHYIERHSRIPVFILRDEAKSANRLSSGNAQPLRVIVPLDGSQEAEQILPAAIDLCTVLSSPARGSIHLAMVLPKTNEQDTEAIEAYNRALQDARAYLTSVTQRLQQFEQHVEVTFSISQQSNISETLAAFATHGADAQKAGDSAVYDVVAMATHGREGLHRLLHASVTEQVLDATRVPALVCKSVSQEDVS